MGASDNSSEAPELPAEVLAELMGLIGDMDERSPAFKEAARAELESTPARKRVVKPQAATKTAPAAEATQTNEPEARLSAPPHSDTALVAEEEAAEPADPQPHRVSVFAELAQPIVELDVHDDSDDVEPSALEVELEGVEEYLVDDVEPSALEVELEVEEDLDDGVVEAPEVELEAVEEDLVDGVVEAPEVELEAVEEDLVSAEQSAPEVELEAVDDDSVNDDQSLPEVELEVGDDDLLAGVSAEARIQPSSDRRVGTAWLRYNWPFLLAAVFIAFGVLLIVLVLAGSS